MDLNYNFEGHEDSSVEVEIAKMCGDIKHYN